MPPIRAAMLKRAAQGVRTYATEAPANVHNRVIYQSRFMTHTPSHHILGKAAAQRAAHHDSTFPLFVRDATSYGALGVLTSSVAFSLYFWVCDVTDYKRAMLPVGMGLWMVDLQ